MPELGELVECAAVDCDRTFAATRRNRKWCSSTCSVRMWRWRQYGKAQRHPLYFDATGRLGPDELRELRERADSELVYAALAGADQATMAKVAGLVLAVDKRLGQLELR